MQPPPLIPSAPHRLPLAFGLMALACFGTTLWLLYEAGCIGDTKAGMTESATSALVPAAVALGDASRALQLEATALWPEVLGLFLIPVTFALIPKRSVLWRIAGAIAVMLAALAAMQWLGAQVEAYGVGACLRR